MEKFLSNLESLLLRGNRSGATDLLTDFLYEIYDKPTSLNLPDPKSLADKSPAEVISILRILLKDTLPNSNNSNQESDFIPNADDLVLIGGIEEELLEQTPLYTLEEETAICEPALSPAGQQLLGTHDESESSDSDSSIVHEGIVSDSAVRMTDRECQSSAEEFGDFGVPSSVAADLLPVIEINDIDELQDFEEPDHFREGLPDKDIVTIADRALQIAIDVVRQHDLDRDSLDFLQNVFIEHGWGNARIAIEGLIENGTSIKHLSLAKQMKDHWDESSDLWIGFYSTRKDISDYTYASSRILSWAFATKFVKNFHEEIEFEEIEHFIRQHLDLWWEEKRCEFRRFFDYLKFIAENFDEIDLSDSHPFRDNIF